MSDAREIIAEAIEQSINGFSLDGVSLAKCGSAADYAIKCLAVAGFVIVPAEQTNPFLVNAPTPGIAQALGNPD